MVSSHPTSLIKPRNCYRTHIFNHIKNLLQRHSTGRMTGKYCGKTLIILRFYTKKWQKSTFLMPFSRKAKIFLWFPNILLRCFQFITAIYHCCINMYYIFCNEEIIRKQKHFISYLVCPGKRTIKWYKELLKLSTVIYNYFHTL